jgi:hypothetical protein
MRATKSRATSPAAIPPTDEHAATIGTRRLPCRAGKASLATLIASDAATCTMSRATHVA